MIRLIAIVALWSYAAVAGLPPTTSKGMQDTTNKTTFNFQFPGMAVTHTGTTASFSDLGEPNTLKNVSVGISSLAGAETFYLVGRDNQNPSATNVVRIAFRNSSALDGTYVTRAATAATTVTVPSGATLGITSGVAAPIYIYAYDNAGTVAIAVAGTDRFQETTLQNVTAISSAAKDGNILYGPSAASNVAIRLIGKAIVQEATAGTWTGNYTELSALSGSKTAAFINLMTNWTSYTPTFSGFGTVSGASFQYQRVGDSILIRGTFTAGTTTATQAQVTLPPGLTIGSGVSSLTVVGVAGVGQTLAGTNLTLANGGNAFLQFGQSSSSTGGLVARNGNDAFVSGTNVSVTTTAIPIAQWTQATTSNIFDAGDYGPTAFTPGSQGFGTIGTTECTHARAGKFLLFDCKFIMGTATAAEARINLPSGLVIDSSAMPSQKVVGVWNKNTTVSAGNGGMQTVSGVGGNGYLTFNWLNPNYNGMANLNGTDFVSGSAGSYMSVQARIPIQGWSTFPFGVAGVRDPDITYTAHVGGASGSDLAPTLCSASPCTTYSQTSGFGFVATRSATGVYQGSWNTNAFASGVIPRCFFTLDGITAVGILAPSNFVTATGIPFVSRTLANASQDAGFTISCSGQRN